MTKEEYKVLQKGVRKYLKSLDKEWVRAELLSKGLLNDNLKTAKGDNLNKGLSILPSAIYGKNTCGMEGQCKYNCLFSTGQNNRTTSATLETDEYILSTAMKKLAERTFMYFKDTEYFYDLLEHEITTLKGESKLGNQKLAIRLNVFSDLDWREYIGKHLDVQFYDYTKHWDRESTENYKYTFSYSERNTIEQLKEKIAQGENVAVIFKGGLPDTFEGIKVVNGDIDDNRYQDENGVIVGLKLKTPVRGVNKEQLSHVIQMA